jgi:putative ABC transport system permease protein
LVVVAAAAYPLFVSASQSELLASGIHAPTVSRYAAGLTYRSTQLKLDETGPQGRPLYEERGAAFAEAASADPALDPTVTEILGPAVEVTLPGGIVPATGAVNGRLFTGDGALDHLTMTDGGSGEGVWLPDLAAEPAGVGPGDTVELRLHGQVVTVPVAGVYRSLYTRSPVGYFQPFNDEFYPPGGCFDCATPPQPILISADQFESIANELGVHEVDVAWQAPVSEDPPPTLEQARALGGFVDHLRARMERDRTPFGQLVPCCGPVFGAVPWRSHGENVFRTAMPEIVQIVEGQSSASQAPILVLSIAALAIAMAVVAAAGAFSFASRRVEAGVLTARGWGPGAVAAKCSLESLAPILVGAIAGFAVAVALITVAGPNGTIDPAAWDRALRASAVAVAVAIAVVAIVSAASYVARHERRERLARTILWVPWELLAFGASWALYRHLQTGGGLVESGGLVRPSGGVFLFPLALSLAVGILAARVAVVVLSHRRPSRPGISAKPVSLLNSEFL